MRLDVHYVENWSLFLDLQILWRATQAVTRSFISGSIADEAANWSMVAHLTSQDSTAFGMSAG